MEHEAYEETGPLSPSGAHYLDQQAGGDPLRLVTDVIVNQHEEIQSLVQIARVFDDGEYENSYVPYCDEGRSFLYGAILAHGVASHFYPDYVVAQGLASARAQIEHRGPQSQELKRLAVRSRLLAEGFEGWLSGYREYGDLFDTWGIAIEAGDNTRPYLLSGFGLILKCTYEAYQAEDKSISSGLSTEEFDAAVREWIA